jgi:hypothetical protein
MKIKKKKENNEKSLIRNKNENKENKEKYE